MTFKHRLFRVLQPFLPVNQRTFGILRFEIGCLMQRFKNAINPFHYRKIYRFRQQQGALLNIGTGGRGLVGWINVDARAICEDVHLALDIRRPLPFKTGQISGIFAEHVLEHLEPREDVPKTLAECHRILAPGSILRIVVPDTARYLRAYVSGNPELWQELGWSELPDDMPTPMHMINHIFHQNGEHLFGYDFASLQVMLRQAGFSLVTQQAFGCSMDQRLAIDRPEHRLYSLYVDARK